MLTKMNQWVALLSAVGLTMLAIHFFSRPQQAFHQLGIVLGAAIAVIGLIQLASFFLSRRKPKTEESRQAKTLWLSAATGTATALIGIILMSNTGILVFAVQTLFALWAVFLGIIKIIISIQYKLDEEPTWTIELALGLLSLGLGAVLFLLDREAVFISAVITGIYLSVYSIYCYVDFGIQFSREWKERHKK